MKEARIECLTKEYSIPDLGLELKCEDVAFVPDHKARGSKDLREGARIGAVKYEYVQRAREIREMPARVVGRRLARPPAGHVAPKPITPQPLTLEDVHRACREAAREGTLAALKEYEASRPPEAPALTLEAVEEVVRRVVEELKPKPRARKKSTARKTTPKGG